MFVYSRDAGSVLPVSQQRVSSVIVETPPVVQDNKVTVEGVLRVVAKLGPAETQRFEQDMKHYDSTGCRTDFIRGVLAAAAAR